jgi:hypothetical protein
MTAGGRLFREAHVAVERKMRSVVGNRELSEVHVPPL